MKRCTNCNSLMPDDAPKCVECGQSAERGFAGKAMTETRLDAGPGAAPGKRPGRIRSAWLLAIQSWRVLMRDKELLVFPLLSGLACLLVLAGFFAGVFAFANAADRSASHSGYSGLGFVYYLVNYFVITYFNAALVACAMIRFRGGNPTVAGGLRAANARLPQIFAWALLAATVGIVLRMLQERFKLIGRIVIALVGAAWTIATYFILPVLVAEKLGPLDAVRRSTRLMKQTWGESLVSHVGIGMVTGLLTFLGVLLIVIATLALTSVTSHWGVLAAGVVAVIAFLVLSALVSSALSTIVLSALYLYAAEEKVPQAFDGVAQYAFAPK